MAARRIDNEAYVRATAVARDVRATVADQVSELIRTYDRMSGGREVKDRIERVNFCLRRLEQARGQQRQARVEGFPVARFVQDEREFASLLREAVIGLAVSSAAWAAAMDYERLRVEEADTVGA